MSIVLNAKTSIYKESKRISYRFDIIINVEPVRTFLSRLQQPVQNPISDNSNVWWNSPKITAIGYPWFYKTTPILSFEGKKQGQTHLFFLV